MKKTLKKLYLLWWNDFISIEAFSSYIQAKYGIICDRKKASRIISIGRKLYNIECGINKNYKYNIRGNTYKV